MSEKFKQDWWDKVLPSKFEDFKSWIGDSTAPSKVMSRDYIKSKGYKSLVDLGCGLATEYFAYKEEYPELKYLGVDGSEYLYDRNVALGVPMLLADADETVLKNNSYEVVFSRHVLEHQPTFQPVLSEMIRIAEKEAIHVFFIKPQEKENIHYDKAQNLFHNTYAAKDIEDFLTAHKDVLQYNWIPMTHNEVALSISKNPLSN